jgi:hypothetical protein
VNKQVSCGIIALTVILLALYPSANGQDKERGRELAGTFCSSCHLQPSPDVLDKRAWNVALAYMGFFLGMTDTSYLADAPQFVREYVAGRMQLMAQDGVIPAGPLIQQQLDWQAIRNYYIDSAPESALPQEGKPELTWQLPQFRIVESDYQSRPAVTTLVRINDEANEAVVGDSRLRSLAVLGADGQLKSEPRQFGPAMLPVDIEFRPGGALVASIGDLYAAQKSEDRPGLIASITPDSTTVLIDGLYRTADMELADLNGDNADDFIVSGFGGNYGSVSWFESQPDGTRIN